MKKETPIGSTTKTFTLTYEHNPYEVNIYTPKRSKGKTVVFPIFNYSLPSQCCLNPVFENMEKEPQRIHRKYPCMAN